MKQPTCPSCGDLLTEANIVEINHAGRKLPKPICRPCDERAVRSSNLGKSRCLGTPLDRRGAVDWEFVCHLGVVAIAIALVGWRLVVPPHKTAVTTRFSAEEFRVPGVTRIHDATLYRDSITGRVFFGVNGVGMVEISGVKPEQEGKTDAKD